MIEAEGAKVDSDAAKEFLYAIENVVKDVSLSQSGCEVNEDGLVMIDSGASVNVCLKWFGESILQEPDGSVQFRGADGRTLQDYGKCQIWLKIGTQLRQYDFHVVEVTKMILLCENGTETHLAKELFFEVRRHTRTLDQVNGVYFVKAQTVHKVKSRVMRTRRRFTESRVRAGDSQKSCVRAEDSQNSRSIMRTSKQITKVMRAS